MTTTKHEAIKIARDVLYTINKCTECGLPSEYNNINDWILDLWTDLPWDEGAIHSLEWLVSDSESIITIQQFNKTMNFNLTEMLLKALIDYQTKVQISAITQRGD